MGDEERDEDGPGWVVVETGRGPWRVLLPPAPPKTAGVAHALAGAELFRPSPVPAERGDGPAARPRGRLLARLVRLLAGLDRRRGPGRRQRGPRR